MKMESNNCIVSKCRKGICLKCDDADFIYYKKQRKYKHSICTNWLEYRLKHEKRKDS